VFFEGDMALVADRTLLFNLAPFVRVITEFSSFESLFKIIYHALVFLFVLEIKPKITVTILFIMTVFGEIFRLPPQSVYIIGLSLFAFLIHYLFFWKKNIQETKKLIFPITYLFVGSIYFNGFLSKLPHILNWISGEGLQGAILAKHIVYVAISPSDSLIFTASNLAEKIILESSLFASALSLTVIFIQFSSLFLVLLPRLWRTLLLVAFIMFHVGVDKIMGISFSQNVILLAYLVFDWGYLSGDTLKWIKRKIK
jgi:hypothetical protein